MAYEIATGAEQCNSPQFDYRDQRIEYLRLAREAEAVGDPALGNRYRLLATNCDLIARGNPATVARVMPKYEINKRRLAEFLAAREAVA